MALKVVSSPLFVSGALAFGAGTIVLTTHYPIASSGAVAAALFCIILSYLFPFLWIAALPALLPVLAFAPWTGWITFEELDILILAVAAGGYARIAFQNRQYQRNSHPDSPNKRGAFFTRIVLSIFAISVLISVFRGFANSGGFTFGWFQGYLEAMNSLRLAKSFFLALALLPLLRMLQVQDPAKASANFSTGMLMGLAGASLAAIWERAAYTSLLDFSSDYRTTALFWEMHVGGAALDGYLALALPFALNEFMNGRSHLRVALAGVVTALALYTCLTTFSRGVYVAIPLGILTLVVLGALQKGWPHNSAKATHAPVDRSPWLAAILLTLGFAVANGWMFPASGYRGAIALLGLVALLLPMGGHLGTLARSQWIVGGLCGVPLAVLASGAAWLVPKGSYLAYCAGFGLTAAMLWALRLRAAQTQVTGVVAWAAYIVSATSVVLVARNWGGPAALAPSVFAAVACVTLAGATGLARRPLWPGDFRWQVSVLCAMGVVVGVTGVFAGGAYMTGRMSTGARDLDTRFSHWKLGAEMLQTPADWWLGKGMGRFPANHFLLGNPKKHPGDFRLKKEGDWDFIRVTGGLHSLGFGELLRVTQRVSVPEAPANVSALVRVEKDVSLLFEVCEKHLLYSDNCTTKEFLVKAAPGEWQTIQGKLTGAQISRGAWYAPRLIAFSFAVQTAGGSADLTQINLVGPKGQNALANGDFSNELAHWFFSSDRFHMPWHIKSMLMHVMFEQGLIGLLLWSVLIGAAARRMIQGGESAHPLAPVLAASMSGFLVVGLFDSLLDVPRVATLFYLIMLMALTMRGGVPNLGNAQDTASERTRLAMARSRSREGGTGSTGGLIKFAKAMGTLAIFCSASAIVASLFAYAMGYSAIALAKTTPAEWIRYAKPWMARQNYLAPVFLPILETWQASIERPPPAGQLPSLGKGQELLLEQIASADIKISSPQELMKAFDLVRAGQAIEMAPGNYRINQAVTTRSGGTQNQPITLRARLPSTVFIEFDTVEGFHVTMPYWIFENLNIRGVCKRDEACEHAFHVVGAARGFVMRNNHVEDFNAHVKVNGEGGRWPDDGLVQFNTMTNQHARKTATPVTPFDLVAASGWQVTDNMVTNFVNEGGNLVSYGIFMKGGGALGRIERNLIVCTTKDISQPGNRVGISWGGGGTEARYCRDRMCVAEHTDGLAANNIVAHCNDSGIDVNRAQRATIAHNTLINTSGVLVRGQSEDVRIEGNLLEGAIRTRDGTNSQVSNNSVRALGNVFKDPDRLQLKRTAAQSPDIPLNTLVASDFCQRKRGPTTWAGALGADNLPCSPPR